MPKAATLRSSPSGQSFDAELAANRAKANRQAGQGARVASNRAATESGTPKTTGPLDTAGIFSRDGRRNSNKRKAKPQATVPCPAYTVRKGDTLAKIARAQLGSAKRYPELMTANPSKVKSARTLRVGTVLTLPCTVPTRKVTRLQGKPVATNASAALAKPANPQKTKPAPAKPLPVWTARPSEFVSDVITRWAKRVGHTVVRDGIEEWKISVPVKIRGSFKHALDQLVVGFEGSGRPLAISVYANKVIRIGRPL